jgi:transcriptional regulator with GAF, ATPase, and Fis domain
MVEEYTVPVGSEAGRELAELAASDEAVHELLRRGMDWLARVVRFDLATLFLLQGERLVALSARGPLASDKVRHHALRLADFPTLRQVLETRRARALTEEDHAHGEGDPFDGLLDLTPGHSCMVVPLCAGERRYGVLTLDRRECEPYPPGVVELAEVVGQMLAVALRQAEQKVAWERRHRREHAHARLLEAELGGEAGAVVEGSACGAVRELAHRARQVAQVHTPVLLVGERGTGKGRLARALHAWGPRAAQPYVPLHCAALPPERLERELLGNPEQAGRLALAHGGTLYLEEVEALPLPLQERLVRALQDKAFTPSGTDRPVRADVRLIASTHGEPQQARAEHRLSEELYYRLSVCLLHLPPLRERCEDMPRLCSLLLAEQARRTGRQGLHVTPEGLALLQAYEWPGNLRELAHVLERAALLSPSSELGPQAFAVPSHVPAAGVPAVSLPPQETEAVPTLEQVQREHILRVLSLTRSRIYGPGGAAELLGLKPSTLQSRMKKLGIERQEQFISAPPAGSKGR